MTLKNLFSAILSLFSLMLLASSAFAGEADIILPDLTTVNFNVFGGTLGGVSIMYFGLVICVIGLIFAIIQARHTKNLPAHKAMLDVSNIIWETCKSYLFQQGKFLIILWTLIAICMIYYFVGLSHRGIGDMIIILACSILGILGSYSVAWFGMRINTWANSRSAFASLRGRPVEVVNIPLTSGMSVGLLLVSVELFFMICILVFLKELAGPCFIGFAIGESLGASALRIAGGIFTKIADIGSDLMKIVFHLPEDDPKNPGVIADCTGDNAGDSVGPTADGFETYGVTGVALIAFLALALAANPIMSATLIIWIFAMRILMILTSLVSYYINRGIISSVFASKTKFDFEQPLTNLVWITSAVSIIVTFWASYMLLSDLGTQYPGLWWALAAIISCGTIAGALIPEFTKVFTSTKSRHVREVVGAARHGGASLDILSGFVAGNFSAFWEGLTILVLMFIAYLVSRHPSILAVMPPGIYLCSPCLRLRPCGLRFSGHGSCDNSRGQLRACLRQRPVNL